MCAEVIKHFVASTPPSVTSSTKTHPLSMGTERRKLYLFREIPTESAITLKNTLSWNLKEQLLVSKAGYVASPVVYLTLNIASPFPFPQCI